ncbi:glycoside hydrolase/deacetylase [Meredithblackwellia eburnea MCA 4105]
MPSYPDFIYEREFVGYGLNKPDPKWPAPGGGTANVAISFVIAYNAGAESNILNGDPGFETYQVELPPRGTVVPNGKRLDTNETAYEYGSRRGVPRLLDLFAKYKMKATWNVCTQALEQSPYWTKELLASGHEIACGGKRFIDYAQVEPEEEAKQIAEAIETLQKITGDKTLPHGWLIDRYSNISPLLYAREHESRQLPLLYSSDSSSDELPYWVPSPTTLDGKPDTGMLVVPVTHDTGDFRFTSKGSGWGSPKDFYDNLVDTFDTLWEEGEEGEPKMMTILLHPLIIGRAGRCLYLEKFLQYISTKEKVWVARRDEIAEHFAKTFPYDPKKAFGITKQVPC